jgi:hypothetical protein
MLQDNHHKALLVDHIFVEELLVSMNGEYNINNMNSGVNIHSTSDNNCCYQSDGRSAQINMVYNSIQKDIFRNHQNSHTMIL